MSSLLPESDIRLQPIPDAFWQDIRDRRFTDHEGYRLRLLAEHAVLVGGFDELICLDQLAFAPFEYQIHAAQIALRRFRGRGMLCDEVGLGKTIEAGLVLKECLLRRIAQRVLIVTPAALVEQWREELAIKFGLPDFVTTYDSEFRAAGSEAWSRFPLLIASLAAARRTGARERIAQIPFDLVIVDEAHHLKNRASASWKFVDGLQRKFILLLTATPVENDLEELYNLINLIKPGQLGTPREFRRRFVMQGDPRQPKNRGRLRELLGDVMVRHSRSQVEIRLPPRQAVTIRVSPSSEETDLYRAVSNCVRDLWGGSALVDSAGEPSAFEQETTDASAARATGIRSTDRFVLLTLQREIGSSPQAAAPTLRALAERIPDADACARLSELAEAAESETSWAKADALDKLLATLLLSDPAEKAILFTHFRRTLDLLARRLRAADVDFVVYHGGLSAEEKRRAIHEFEIRARVLLSTEAAGEGRNLQFCRTMINFDLPWNPMRIEQRIGRIHRVGQNREVRIFNFAARGTIEDYLLDLLDRKLNLFELVIGEMDMILGRLSDERDFEELLMDIWVRGRSEGELRRGFAQLGESLLEARRAHERTHEYDEALFGGDFAE
jgi:SNF2 family DNA or RNA helicase